MQIAGLVLLLIAYFALSSDRVVEALRTFYDNRFHGGQLIALLLIPYLLAALPGVSDDPASFALGLAIMLAYLFVPGLALLFRPVTHRPLDVLDIIAILALWFPVELDLLPDVRAEIFSVSIPLPMLTGIVLGFLLFLVIRPTDRLGYTYALRPRDLLAAMGAFLVFGLVGMPLGVGTGFIQFSDLSFNLREWLASFFGIYFFNALPEELLFRGIIQNLVEGRIRNQWWALGITAVIFGLSHINNTTAFHTPPNWPYVIMATLAGVAYGWAWCYSEKVTTSALTHTLVNFTWRVFFGS